MSTPPFRILITPLNWGLGHATRCLPIAAAFLSTSSKQAARSNPSIEIHWASDGDALALLRAELPKDTVIHELPSYGIRYPTASASVNMILGGPRMGAAIVQEAKAVADLHKHFNYSFILSDNRFGCRVDGVPSAILTHQIYLPIQNWFSRKLGNLLNHRLLAKFDQIVVPDQAAHPRLAGKMSAQHPKIPTNYIGPISRFSVAPPSEQPSTPTGITQLAIVLSGPEPQRTRLEVQLLKALTKTPRIGTVLLVRGKPKDAPTISKTLIDDVEKAENRLIIHDFLGSMELMKVLAEAKIVISRPGYTTVMDLAKLGRKAIYIPTPGQPEQEWLGKSLAASGEGVCVAQQALVLAEAVKACSALTEKRNGRPAQAEYQLDTWVRKVLDSTAAA